jgi:hypothetical protein
MLPEASVAEAESNGELTSTWATTITTIKAGISFIVCLPEHIYGFSDLWVMDSDIVLLIILTILK